MYLPITNNLNRHVNNPANTSDHISLISIHSIIVKKIKYAVQHLNFLLLQRHFLICTIDGLLCMYRSSFMLIILYA